MHYEVIIIGATFTAAGLVQVYGDKCLVLERRPQAGYEFLNAVKFGTDYDAALFTDEAKALYAKFVEKEAFDGERICLFDCASPLYSLLEGKNIFLNMEIVSVEKEGAGFKVEAHGVSGYRTFTADKVIDTTVHKDMIVAKSLNLLVNAEEEDAPALPVDVKTEKWGYPEDTLVKCSVPSQANYIDARRAVKDFIDNVKPSQYKVAFVADCFDYEVKAGYPAEKDGIVYMPSCAYNNPLLAFDAGVLYAKGGVL